MTNLLNIDRNPAHINDTLPGRTALSLGESGVPTYYWTKRDTDGAAAKAGALDAYAGFRLNNSGDLVGIRHTGKCYAEELVPDETLTAGFFS